MDTVPVYARALRADHLPVIDGTIAELVVAARMGDEVHVRWVPAEGDGPIEHASYALDALVPCVRRADWRGVGR